jgi:hypothetical protein
MKLCGMSSPWRDRADHRAPRAYTQGPAPMISSSAWKLGPSARICAAWFERACVLSAAMTISFLR